MREMQTIVTNDRGVYQSVCLFVSLSRGSSRLHCAKMAERIKMLFGVNTLGSPRNTVLDAGLADLNDDFFSFKKSIYITNISLFLTNLCTEV